MMALLQNKSLYATPRLSLPAVERRGEKIVRTPSVKKKIFRHEQKRLVASI